MGGAEVRLHSGGVCGRGRRQVLGAQEQDVGQMV